MKKATKKSEPEPAAKRMRRVFTLDSALGDVMVVVTGPAGSVRCSSTEQYVSVSTGAEAPTPGAHYQPPAPTRSGAIVAHSTDVTRSGEEFTVTDPLDSIPGGIPPGMTEDEAYGNPDAVLAALERTRSGMIGRMSSEVGSSDTLLMPGGN